MPRMHSRVVVCGSPASFTGWRSIAHRYMSGCGEEVIFISEVLIACSEERSQQVAALRREKSRSPCNWISSMSDRINFSRRMSTLFLLDMKGGIVPHSQCHIFFIGNIIERDRKNCKEK